MRFDNNSLFVNTGRKPLSAMQRRKKNNRNNIFLGVCLAVIAVLCIFVGLIVHVWLNYDEEPAEPVKPAVTEAAEQEKAKKAEAAKKAAEKKAAEEAKKKEEEKKAKESKNKYQSFGEESDYSRAVEKAFSALDGTYAYGYVMLNDGSRYINNTARISNSTALSAFLVEYICAKIYTGEFDYDTYVSGYSGEQLIDSLIKNGSVESANILISYFTPAKLNSYMSSNGYANTYFGGAIADGSGSSYTTVEDVAALISKIADKSRLFPYSDLYGRMKNSRVTGRIRAQLPSGATAANISAAADGEMFDAAMVYSPNGNYIFVSMANGYSDDGTAANTAIANGAAAVYNLLNK